MILKRVTKHDGAMRMKTERPTTSKLHQYWASNVNRIFGIDLFHQGAVIWKVRLIGCSSDGTWAVVVE